MPAAVVKDGTVMPKFRQGKISPPFLTAKFSPGEIPPPPLYGHFGLGRGGRGIWGRGPPPLWFLIILKKPWGLGCGGSERGGPG